VNTPGDEWDGLLLADGFEDALLGIGGAFNQLAAVYDYDKCVDILIKRDGMSMEDAEEWMSFNVCGAYVGEHTPIFLRISAPPHETTD